MRDIYAHIDTHADEYIADLQTLVRQPSVSAQGIGLRQSPGEAVENKPTAVVAFQLFFDQANDNLVGHKLARVHDGGNLVAHLGAGGACGAQHVTGGKLDHAAFVFENARLRPLPGPRWAQKYDVHRLAVPFFPPRFLPRS